MKKFLSILAFVLLSFIAVDAQKREQLFTLKETPAARASKSSIASVREAEIQVNFASMQRGGSTPLRIALFDGKTYEAMQLTSEGFETRGMDDFTWRGK